MDENIRRAYDDMARRSEFVCDEVVDPRALKVIQRAEKITKRAVEPSLAQRFGKRVMDALERSNIGYTLGVLSGAGDIRASYRPTDKRNDQS